MIQIICDGCHIAFAKAEAGQEFGTVKKAVYCDKCAMDVKAFMESRDKLHEQLAKQWCEGMLKLEFEFREKHPDGALPDE